MRFFLSICLLLLFFHDSKANDYNIIEDNNRKGLVDNKGKIIIPAEYDDLGWSSGSSEVIDDIIGYKKGDLWGLINLKNIPVTSPDYIEIYPFNREYLIAARWDNYKLNRRYGLINSSGKPIIPFEYAMLKKSGDQLIAGRKLNNQLFFGVLNLKGKPVIPLDYKEVKKINPNIYKLTGFDGKGYLTNNEGSPLINFWIDEIKALKNKHFIVEVKGKQGLLSATGKLLSIPLYRKININDDGRISALPSAEWKILSFENEPIQTLTYDSINPIDSNLYYGKRKDYSFIIDREGKELFTIKDSKIFILNDSFAAIKPDTRYGMVNYRGDTVYKPEFDSIRVAGKRCFLYVENGREKGWQMGDLSGKLFPDTFFDQILEMKNSYMAVRKGQFWGIMNNLGNILIQPKYDTVYQFKYDRFLVGFHKEPGVVDTMENWQSLPRKGDLYLLDDNRYLVSSYNGSYILNYFGDRLFYSENYLRPMAKSFIEEDYKHRKGIVNSDYKSILPVRYDQIKEIESDSVYLFKNEYGWGSVNRNGAILFQNDQRFEDVRDVSEEYIGVKINGKYGFVDYLGRLRIAYRYEDIGFFHNNIANIKILGKWGCINKKEELIVQPYYQEIGLFNNGLSIARKDNKYGIINSSGKVKLPFEYDSINSLKQGGFICYLEGKAGLADKNGIQQFYPKFDEIRDLDNGYILVKRKGKYGLFTDSGVINIPIIYDKLIYDHYNKVMLAYRKPKWKRLFFDL